MKTLTFALSMILLFGTVAVSFAGNHPALTYPSGTLVTSRDRVQLDEVTPWNKGGLHYAMGVVGPGLWYDRCPAMPGMPFTKFNRIAVTLPNGKKVMVGCPNCIEIVRSNPDNYKSFMF